MSAPGGEADRAVEARHLLKLVDDTEHELGPSQNVSVRMVRSPFTWAAAALSSRLRGNLVAPRLNAGSGHRRGFVLSEHEDAEKDVDAQGEDR